MTEVAQVNWIANESIENRLLDEVRGPAIGQFYDFLLFVIAVAVVTKLAVVWSDQRQRVVERISRDRDTLALTIGWAVVPTASLGARLLRPSDLFGPVCLRIGPRSGVARCLRVCARVPRDPRPLQRFLSDGTHTDCGAESQRFSGGDSVVLLVIGSLGSASTLQEDLEGPARYAAQHAEQGDVFALPDHAITSVIDYYLASDNRHIPLWPQLGVRQRYVEGFDLSLASGSRLSSPHMARLRWQRTRRPTVHESHEARRLRRAWNSRCSTGQHSCSTGPPGR